MNETQDVNELEQVFSAGDSWLVKYGVVTPIMHNNIILNLRIQLPVKHLEYFLDSEQRTINLTLYVGLFFILFKSKKKLIANAFEILNQYLHNYEIKIKIRRFKKDTLAL